MTLSVLAGQIVLADDHNNLVPAVARKTADETVNNSATFQNDDHMALSVVANAQYELYGEWRYNSGATPDIKFQWTFPTGLTMRWNIYGPVAGWTSFALTQADGAALDGATDIAVQVGGIVLVGSTAGTLRVQWAQNTANASDTKVLTGSYIRLKRIS